VYAPSHPDAPPRGAASASASRNRKRSGAVAKRVAERETFAPKIAPRFCQVQAVRKRFPATVSNHEPSTRVRRASIPRVGRSFVKTSELALTAFLTHVKRRTHSQLDCRVAIRADVRTWLRVTANVENTRHVRAVLIHSLVVRSRLICHHSNRQGRVAKQSTVNITIRLFGTPHAAAAHWAALRRDPAARSIATTDAPKLRERLDRRAHGVIGANHGCVD
jgi:hypothetical protein